MSSIFKLAEIGDNDNLIKELDKNTSIINDIDGIGMQPLHHACENGKIETIKLFIF